ncbi:MAG: DUF3349 domain-containing protein [Actinomycetales bacterium]
MSVSATVTRVLGWLRAGYPQGVPEQDYVALLGILRHRLTEDEVVAVASAVRADLNATGQAEALTPDQAEDEIRTAVHRVVGEEPVEEDVARVSAALAAGGWPLAHVDDPTPFEVAGQPPAAATGADTAAADDTTP